MGFVAERYVRARGAPTAAQIARMVTLYDLGLSVRDVGKVVGRDRRTVMKHLKAEGVALRPRVMPGKFRRADVVASEVKRLHDGGMAPQELADYYNASLSTVYSRLREAKAVIRPPGRPPTRPDLVPGELKRRYDAGASLAQLASRYQTSVEMIRRRLREAGTVMRPPGRPIETGGWPGYLPHISKAESAQRDGGR